jgi:hypothetical protein
MPITTYTISGSVGAAGAGATITLSGASSATTTAAPSTGNYTFGGLLPGTYLVTPSLAGAEFSPTSRIVIIVAGNTTGVNFTTFTPSAVESNSDSTLAPGQNFATEIVSPRTSVMGTDLRTQIIG